MRNVMFKRRYTCCINDPNRYTAYTKREGIVGEMWTDSDKWTTTCGMEHERLVYWYTRKLSGFAYTKEAAMEIIASLNRGKVCVEA